MKKGYDSRFNSWINKKDLSSLIIMSSQYFPELFRSFEGNINVKVDLPSYATKTDLKKCNAR